MSYQNVLLIDDDPDDREIFVSAMEIVSPVSTCIAIRSAAEAFDQLTQELVHPDIIFLDLNMPVMNGQQFLKEIKGNPGLAAIPVVVLSTSSHHGTIEVTKELGAQDFITKPDKFDQLVDRLQQIFTPSK
jgi:CheY-like chemotaxis protein